MAEQTRKITGRAMDALHEGHSEYSAVWKKCRAAVKGQRAIHKGGTDYLPRLSGQTDDEYNAYKARALYFNATGRTLEAMVGLAFRKPGTIETPTAMAEWVGDLTMTGISLDGVSRDIMTQVLEVGRLGVLVDYPVAPAMPEGQKMTLEQAKKLDLRPYVAIWKAERVLNWEAKRIGAATKLYMVTLEEAYVDDKGKERMQVRELTLESGFYEQVVWRKLENQTESAKFEEISRVAPLKNSKPLSVIPFWFIGPKEKNWDICDPPIEDLVYVNISHYQNSADLENGAHVSGLPTPYITGVAKDEKTVLQLGTGAAWLIPDAAATVGFCQVGSEGFASLEKLMDRKEAQMAAIGARIIAPEKKAAETAETAQIRRSGESSVLAEIVRLASKSIEAILKFMADWGGITGKIRFAINTDFLPMGMSAQELTALLGAVQGGKMSTETFFDCLKSGEVVSETLTYEEEKQRIENDGPALGTMEDDVEDGK